jgi:hypothetical protein
MTESYPPKMKHIIGPDGSPMTIDDLPIPGATRWVIRRKAEVSPKAQDRELALGLNSARGQEARLNTEGLLRPAIVSKFLPTRGHVPKHSLRPFIRGGFS